MKLNLANKLVILMVLAACLVVAMIFGVTRFSMMHDFATYLDKAELSGIETFAGKLESKYAQERSWNFVKSDATAIWWIIAESEREELHQRVPPSWTEDFRPAPLPAPPDEDFTASQLPQTTAPPVIPPASKIMPPEGASPGGALPPPSEIPPGPLRASAGDMPPAFPKNRMAFFRRIGLFDQGGALVWGNAAANASKQSRPVVVNGQQVGYLKLIGRRTLSKEIEKLEAQFVAEESRNLFIVSTFAVLVAAAVAFAFSRHLTQAITILTQGTRSLSTGNFSTRVSLDRGDELGKLADDFNRLASRLQQQDLANRRRIATSDELRGPIEVLGTQVQALQDGTQPVNPQTLAVLYNQTTILKRLLDDLKDES